MYHEIAKQLEKVYIAIDEIRKESQYSGWHKIADNISREVKALENLIEESY